MKFESGKVKEFFDVQWGDTNKTKTSYVPEGYLAYSASGPDGFLDTYDYDLEGVVLSAIGANCGVTYFAEGKWSCIKNTIRILPKENLSDATYFYYLSKTANFWPKRGSAQPFISQTDIRELELQIPSLEVQTSVGRALRRLDEKIENNTRISFQLEQIAQTVFKSWFVDFDPVHAKARGEKLGGMDDDTAALFPNSFDGSEFGEIPRGFTHARFDSFCEVLLGGTPSKSKPDFWDGSIPWINSGAINDFRILEATRFITELGLSKSSCKLLPTGTTVIAITGATLGQFSRVEIETAANQSVIGIRALDNALKDYVYLWIANNIGQLTAKSTGGAQQHINRNDVSEQLVLLPTAEIAAKFSEFVEPFFESISNLMFQNLTLARLRDSLLPRLISGELEISDESLGE